MVRRELKYFKDWLMYRLRLTDWQPYRPTTFGFASETTDHKIRRIDGGIEVQFTQAVGGNPTIKIQENKPGDKW